MNENITQMIEELEMVVRFLHRSAADLDNAIEQIKLMRETEKEEYLIYCIRSVAKHRDARKKYQGYDELDEVETDIWNRLIADTSVINEES